MQWRDDGLVVMAGRDETGPRLALYAPATDQITPLIPPPAAWEPALTVALPGARIALLETTRDGKDTVATTGGLWLLLPGGSQIHLADADWLSSFAGLEEPRTLALEDGRILLTGRSGTSVSARILDPGRADVRLRQFTAVPHELMPRGDGSVIALSEQSVEVLRENARTPFDNPGGTLLADDTADNSVLALDAPGRFRREGLSLISEQAYARFDVSQLQYEAVALDVRVTGPAELLLRRIDGPERAIALGTERLGPSLCGLEGTPGDAVRIERRGTSVLIRSSRAERTCALSGLEGPISLAMQALAPGVHIDELEVTRLP